MLYIFRRGERFRLSEAWVERDGVRVPRLPIGRQGFTITARLTALSREQGGCGVIRGLEGRCGKEERRTSPLRGSGGERRCARPQTPYRSSGVYDNGAPHGAFTRARRMRGHQRTRGALWKGGEADVAALSEKYLLYFSRELGFEWNILLVLRCIVQ